MRSLPPGDAVPRLFVRLIALTALGILLQAVTAGTFVGQDGRDAWITAHGVIADVTWVLALTTAGYAHKRVRRTSQRRLRLGAALLFLLTLGQTGVGHLITDKGMDGLIVVHVPLAMAIVGVVTWLGFAAASTRRGQQPSDPYGPSSCSVKERSSQAS